MHQGDGMSDLLSGNLPIDLPTDVIVVPDEGEWNLLKFIEAKVSSGSRENRCTYCRSAYDPNVSTRWFKKSRSPTGEDDEKDEKDEEAKHKPKDEARNYALNIGFGVPVISKQRNFVDKRTGQHATQRSYLVTSWPSFLKRFYRSGDLKKLQDRTFYENIYNEDPCRPFVDVEVEEEGVLDDFGRPTERYHARSEAVLCMAKNFVDAVHTLFDRWNRRVTHMYVLDSSSRNKFSQHLVFHLDDDDARLSSSIDLKTLFMFWFTKGVVSVDSATKKARVSNPRISEGEQRKIANDIFGADPFFWRCGEEKAIKGSDYAFIADVRVFGDKSREFRLIGSTKSGQNRFMSFRTKYDVRTREIQGRRPEINFIESNDFYQKKEDRPPTYEESVNKPVDDKVFYKVLVTYLGTGEGKPRTESDEELCLLSVEFKGFAEMESKRRLALRKQNPTEDRSEKESKRRATGCDVQFCQKVSQVYDRLPKDLKDMWDEAGEKKSDAMTCVADDILHQNSRTMAGESVSFLRYFPHVEDEYGTYVGESCIASFSSSSKYCSIKGGEHASNHVYFVADFKRMVYYQRCWNAECISKTSSRPCFPMRINADKKKNEEVEKMMEEMFYDSLSRTSSQSCKGEDMQSSQRVWSTVSDFLEIRRKFRKELSVFLGETAPDDAHVQRNEVFIYPTLPTKEDEDVVMTDLIDLIVFEETKVTEEPKRKKQKIEKKKTVVKIIDSDEELLNSLF